MKAVSDVVFLGCTQKRFDDGRIFNFVTLFSDQSLEFIVTEDVYKYCLNLNFGDSVLVEFDINKGAKYPTLRLNRIQIKK